METEVIKAILERNLKLSKTRIPTYWECSRTVLESPTAVDLESLGKGDISTLLNLIHWNAKEIYNSSEPELYQFSLWVVRDKNGLSVATLLAFLNFSKAFDVLLDCSDNCPRNDGAILLFAAIGGAFEFFKYYLEKYADFSHQYKSWGVTPEILSEYVESLGRHDMALVLKKYILKRKLLREEGKDEFAIYDDDGNDNENNNNNDNNNDNNNENTKPKRVVDVHKVVEWEEKLKELDYVLPLKTIALEAFVDHLLKKSDREIISFLQGTDIGWLPLVWSVLSTLRKPLFLNYHIALKVWHSNDRLRAEVGIHGIQNLTYRYNKFLQRLSVYNLYLSDHLVYTNPFDPIVQSEFVVQSLNSTIPSNQILFWPLREKYLKNCTLENGFAHTIVGKTEFQENFHEFSRGQCELIDWNNVLVIGGSVCACLLPVPQEWKDKKQQYYMEVSEWSSSDIDLCLYGFGTTDNRNSRNLITEKLVQIHKAIVDACPDVPVEIISNSESITFMRCYPYRNIQVMGHFSSINDVLFNVDIDCTAVGYNGKDVMMLPRAKCAIQTRTNIADKFYYGVRGCPNYEKRLLKYANRGFSIYEPGLARYSIRDDILKEPNKTGWCFRWSYDTQDNAGKTCYPAIGILLLKLAEKFPWMNPKILSLNSSSSLPYGPNIGISKVKEKIQRKDRDIDDEDSYSNAFDGYTHYYRPPEIVKDIRKWSFYLLGNHSGFFVPDWYAGILPTTEYRNIWAYRSKPSCEKFTIEPQWYDLFSMESVSEREILSALFAAGERYLFDFVAELIQLGFEPSQTKNTLLLYAISEGNLKFVNLLISKGASLYEKDKDGHCVLHYALCNGVSLNSTMDSLFFLIKNGYNFRNSDIPTVISQYLLYKSSVEVLEVLKLIEISIEDLFHVLCKYLQNRFKTEPEIIKLLYSPKMETMKPNTGPANLVALFIQAHDFPFLCKNTEIFKTFHELGIPLTNIDSNGNDALLLSIRKYKPTNINLDDIKSFVTFFYREIGIPVINNSNQENILFMLLSANLNISKEFLEFLICCGVDLFQTDINGDTAISLSVRKGLNGVAWILARDFSVLKSQNSVDSLTKLAIQQRKYRVAIAILTEFGIPIPSCQSSVKRKSKVHEEDELIFDFFG